MNAQPREESNPGQPHRQKADESLKDAILDSALDCVITIDRTSRIIEFNPAAEKTFGYKKDEVVGKTLMETIIPPSLRMAHKAGMEHYIETGEGPVLGRRIEITACHSDGSEFPVELAIKPFRLEETEYFAAYIRDITERQKAEQELKASEGKANALLEYSPAGILAVDSDGRIIFLNSMIEQVFGYNRDELMGQDVEVLIPDRFKKPHVEHRREFMQELGVRVMGAGRELKGRHKNGQVFHIEVGLSFVETPSGPLVIAFVTDISIRKNVEQELVKAKEAAEAANRAKSQFLANMSHEIRTPMNAIMGISQALSRYKTENLNKQQLEGYVRIHEAGQRLMQLINDILDLSKIEAHRMPVTYKAFSVDELIGSVRGLGQILIRDKAIEFGVETDASVPNVVVSDMGKLHQVLVNVLGNAVKFTEEGHVRLRVFGTASTLNFEVQDSGIGIAEQDIESIFDEFTQVDSSSTKKYPGTGLGLTICREMLKMLGGEITVKSELGRGTLVRFWVPFDSAPDALETGTPDQADAPGQENDPAEETADLEARPLILVAEDEEAGRVVAELILGDIYRLVFARGGHEAVEKYGSERPDLVLMDIMMPDMDGYQVYDRIVERAGVSRVPIIAFTALAMKGDEEKLLSHGFDDYVTKPVDEESLKSTIKKHLAL